jgi:molybdopterin molybdotransferase
MKPLADAQREVLAAMERLESEVVELRDALGRVTAESCISGVEVPPFANSAMDGFAVVASDVSHTPVVLQVLEDVAAGSVPRPGQMRL